MSRGPHGWRVGRTGHENDVELDVDRDFLRRTLERLDFERMTIEAETFAIALSRDLIEPADFVA